MFDGIRRAAVREGDEEGFGFFPPLLFIVAAGEELRRCLAERYSYRVGFRVQIQQGNGESWPGRCYGVQSSRILFRPENVLSLVF